MTNIEELQIQSETYYQEVKKIFSLENNHVLTNSYLCMCLMKG